MHIYKRMQRIGQFFFLILAVSIAQAQDVKIINGGFEDRPRMGRVDDYDPIEGWFDCGRIDFPNESPPDIHQGVNRSESYWENTQGSVQGKTYLGMVVRESESYESLSQRLAMPLRAGKCYSFSIFISQSPKYISGIANSNDKKNFTNPTVFRLWGGEGLCADDQLLLESPPVNHTKWQEYQFKVEPNKDYRYIRIEAFYETPVLFPYNGHLLLDNASDFELIECEENVELYVAEKRPEKKVVQKKMPAHKAKKKKQEVFAKGENEVKIDTIVYQRPENKERILALDRSQLKKGQSIRIDKLYFEADTSTINIESFQVLNELYDFLIENDDIYIEVGGHTNNIPSHSYCDKLSTDRAKAVANYLITKGVQSEKISYRGYGKRKPIASNGTPEGRKKNQRVEIKIIGIG